MAQVSVGQVKDRTAYARTYFYPNANPQEGINFTNETLAYMTSYSRASALADIVAGMGGRNVIEACAGIGGNTMGFAQNQKINNVISYEILRDRWVMLKNNTLPFRNVKAYNHEFSIGEDLQLLDINDDQLEKSTIVYFDPPWLPPSATISKDNYILAGMKVSGKLLEEWCKNLVDKNRYLGVVLHVPPEYNLVLPGHLIMDKEDGKSRLLFYTHNSEAVDYLKKNLKITEYVHKALDVGSVAKSKAGNADPVSDIRVANIPEQPVVSSVEQELEAIPNAQLVQTPKAVMYTYLMPNFPQKPYSQEFSNPKAIHLGQRKLLISEIEFLTRVLRKARENNLQPRSDGFLYTLLYVGAAPGQHIPTLSEMFPEIEFVLYDPAKFYISGTKAIKIHNELFTDDLVSKYATDRKKENRLLFVSDIRTAPRGNTVKSKGLDPAFELEVEKDLERQKGWVNALKPVRSLLKFRLPFTNKEEKLSTEYFDGIINFQAYAPSQSAETRLEVGNNPTMIKYDHQTYEEQMFYFNTEYRIHSYKHYDTKYGWSYDTIREYFVLKRYLDFRGRGYNDIPKYSQRFDTLTNSPEGRISEILDRSIN